MSYHTTSKMRIDMCPSTRRIWRDIRPCFYRTKILCKTHKALYESDYSLKYNIWFKQRKINHTGWLASRPIHVLVRSRAYRKLLKLNREQQLNRR